MPKLDKIGFFANLIGAGTNHGYGYSAVQLIEAWQNQGVPVWWGDLEAPLGFNFVQPHGYEYTIDRVNIGYTPWESTKLPDAWPYYMNKMTEIWTTSYACKEWFKQAGIEKPIRVLHHGINKEHWPSKLRKRKKKEPFKFLHVGEPSFRKGGKTAYEAFKKIYGNKKEFLLVLKGQPSFEIDIDNVFVIDGTLTQYDLMRIHHKCHAMIYPTQGEGFGLIPLQAAATGMPTLVTAWSGPLDYIEYCYPLEVEDIIECDYEPHEGTWALPSREHLEQWMQWVVQEQKYAFQDSYETSRNMDHYWSWDYQATISLNWFRELLLDFS
jgi:glycosyltransferase involved in cell wall biosynthesis